MFEISPESMRAIREQLSQFASDIPGLSAALDSDDPEVPHMRPFVQLSSDEMSGDEVDRLLGYAGIPSSNSPIGLPFSFDPIRVGAELAPHVLLFPLDGL